MLPGYDKIARIQRHVTGTLVTERQTEGSTSGSRNKEANLGLRRQQSVVFLRGSRSPYPSHNKMAQKGNPQRNGNIGTRNTDSRDTTSQLRWSETRMSRV